MAEGPDEKLPFRFVSIIDIETATRGLVRFNNWTVKANTEIEGICTADLSPRQFAERLFVELATDPLLTEGEVQQWTDAELLGVATTWWEVVDRLRNPPIVIEDFEAFQDAVQQRNAEQKQRLNATLEKIAALRLQLPERRTIERLTEALAVHDSELQKAIERMQLTTHQQTATAFREFTFPPPDRLALEAIYERVREAQMFAGPTGAEIARIVTAITTPSRLIDYAAETKKLHREMVERLRVYEVAFDTGRLKAALGNLETTAYKRFVPDITALESVAGSFTTPWIDRLKPDVSVTGIARLVAFSAAAQVSNPFAGASVTTMREALGDWREVMMPSRFLPETNLREQFYIDQGFDTNLVRLPEPAFSEALNNLGLIPPQIAPEHDDIDEEEVLRRRMSRVYKLLFRLERSLRAYIDRVMIDKYGPDWELHRCHGNGQIYKKWVQKRDQAVNNGLQPQRLIQYADFTEYADLITKSDNWKEIFEQVFDRSESVRESFHRLAPVRVSTMHARPITKTELMLASAEVKRLLIAIGELDNANDD